MLSFNPREFNFDPQTNLHNVDLGREPISFKSTLRDLPEKRFKQVERRRATRTLGVK